MHADQQRQSGCLQPVRAHSRTSCVLPGLTAVLQAYGHPLKLDEREPLLTIFAVVIPGRSFMIASDAIVLFVTWANTYGIRKTALSAQFRTPLLTMLLRDGE